MAISTYLLIITLNINGLSSPIKRHRVGDWIKKQEPCICCLQETHFRAKDTQTESEQMGKDISCKCKWQENGAVILISDKTDFKTKSIKKNKEGHYIMTTQSIQEEDSTLTNA